MIQALLMGVALAGPNVFVFEVGEVKGTIKSPDVALTKAQAGLECHIEDGSGIVDKYPSKSLQTDLESQAQEGMYSIEVTAGSLWDWTLFSTLRSCAYTLSLRGVDVNTGENRSGRITLVGSTGAYMTEGQLVDLMGDEDLNVRISENRLKPLEVEAAPFPGSLSEVQAAQ